MDKWWVRLILLGLIVGFLGWGVWREVSSRREVRISQAKAPAEARVKPAPAAPKEITAEEAVRAKEKERRAELETLMPAFEIPTIPSIDQIETMTVIPFEMKELLRQIEITQKIEEMGAVEVKIPEAAVLPGIPERAPPAEGVPEMELITKLPVTPVAAPPPSLKVYDQKIYHSFLRYFFLWVNGAAIEPDPRVQIKMMESPKYAFRASYGVRRGMKVILLEKLRERRGIEEVEVPVAPKEIAKGILGLVGEEEMAGEKEVTPSVTGPEGKAAAKTPAPPTAPALTPVSAPPAPPPSLLGAKIVAFPVPPVVMANGIDTSTVFATVTDQNNVPFVNHTVGFTLISGPTSFFLPGFGGGAPSLEPGLRGDFEKMFSQFGAENMTNLAAAGEPSTAAEVGATDFTGTLGALTELMTAGDQLKTMTTGFGEGEITFGEPTRGRIGAREEIKLNTPQESALLAAALVANTPLGAGATKPSDSSGNANVGLNATTTPGTALVRAEDLSVTFADGTHPTDFATVLFLPLSQEAAAIDVTTSPKVLTGDGVSTSTVTALVTDVDGNPVANAVVAFTLPPGALGTLSAPFASTNALGIATVLYTAPAQAATDASFTIAIMGSVSTTVGLLSDSDTVTVNPPAPAASPSINDTSIPNACAGAAISQTFTVTGGEGTLTFSAANLPAGLSLAKSGNQTAALTGTVAVAGTYPFSITVTDAMARSDTKSFTLIVRDRPAVTSFTANPPGIVNVGDPVTFDVTFTGDPTASSFEVVFNFGDGATETVKVAPPNPLAASAVHPYAAANHPAGYNATVTITDNNACVGQGGPLNVQVNRPPVITSTCSTSACLNTPYQCEVTASDPDGDSPLNFSLVAGSFPGGMTLTPLTATSARVNFATGTTNFSFTVRVEDGRGGQATQTTDVTLSSVPSIDPATLPAVCSENPLSHTFEVTGGKSPFTFATGSIDYSMFLAIPNPEPASGDNFGHAVASLGNKVVVGAPGDDTPAGGSAGTVYVFDPSSATPLVPVLIIRDPPQAIWGGEFGISVATVGNKIVVGAHRDNPTVDGRRGSVYVFDGSSGALLLNIPNSRTRGEFGFAVATDGNDIWVGVPTYDWYGVTDGAVFVIDATTGAEKNAIGNPFGDALADFGWSVAAGGTRAAVGAPRTNGDAGAAYAYDNDPASPTYRTRLFDIPNPQSNPSDAFGYSVAIVENNILVGTPLDDVGAGAANEDVGSAYLFSGVNGALLRTFSNPIANRQDNFGHAVASLGNKVLVGAYLDDTVGDNNGTVYVFDGQFGSATFGNLLKTIPNPEPAATGGDGFGFSISSLGSSIVVGSPTDSKSGSSSGTVFLFKPIALPQGVNLSSDGVLSGTPTESGNFNFKVIVTDACGQTAERNFSLTVNPVPTVTATNNGPIQKGQNATVTANWTATTGPYTVTYDYGNDGTVDVTHNGVGGTTDNDTRPYNACTDVVVKVTVTDANGCSSSATTTVVVNCPPAFTTTCPADAVENVTFQLIVNATDPDGDTPLAFTLVSVPTNANGPMTIEVLSATSVVLKYKPLSSAAELNFAFTVRVTDGKGGQADFVCTVTVTPNRPIVNLSNNNLAFGSTNTICVAGFTEAQQTFEITNAGTLDLTVNSIEEVLANDPDNVYEIRAVNVQPGGGFPAVLRPFASFPTDKIIVTVAFRPGDNKLYTSNGWLQVKSNDPFTPVAEVAATGTGSGPKLVYETITGLPLTGVLFTNPLNPEQRIDEGSVYSNILPDPPFNCTTSLVVRIRNTGDAPLVFASAVIPAVPFEFGNVTLPEPFYVVTVEIDATKWNQVFAPGEALDPGEFFDIPITFIPPTARNTPPDINGAYGGIFKPKVGANIDPECYKLPIYGESHRAQIKMDPDDTDPTKPTPNQDTPEVPPFQQALVAPNPGDPTETKSGQNPKGKTDFGAVNCGGSNVRDVVVTALGSAGNFDRHVNFKAITIEGADKDSFDIIDILNGADNTILGQFEGNSKNMRVIRAGTSSDFATVLVPGMPAEFFRTANPCAPNNFSNDPSLRSSTYLVRIRFTPNSNGVKRADLRVETDETLDMDGNVVLKEGPGNAEKAFANGPLSPPPSPPAPPTRLNRSILHPHNLIGEGKNCGIPTQLAVMRSDDALVMLNTDTGGTALNVATGVSSSTRMAATATRSGGDAFKVALYDPVSGNLRLFFINPSAGSTFPQRIANGTVTQVYSVNRPGLTGIGVLPDCRVAAVTGPRTVSFLDTSGNVTSSFTLVDGEHDGNIAQVMMMPDVDGNGQYDILVFTTQPFGPFTGVIWNAYNPDGTAVNTFTGTGTGSAAILPAVSQMAVHNNQGTLSAFFATLNGSIWQLNRIGFPVTGIPSEATIANLPAGFTPLTTAVVNLATGQNVLILGTTAGGSQVLTYNDSGTLVATTNLVNTPTTFVICPTTSTNAQLLTSASGSNLLVVHDINADGTLTLKNTFTIDAGAASPIINSVSPFVFKVTAKMDATYFGKVALGSTRTLTGYLLNGGNVQTKVSLASSSAQFLISLDNVTFLQTIPDAWLNQGKRTFYVRFVPESPIGLKTANLTITSSDAGAIPAPIVLALSGTATTPELLVNTATANNQDRPSVAMDASGNALIGWVSLPNGGTNDSSGNNYAVTIAARKFNSAGSAQTFLGTTNEATLASDLQKPTSNIAGVSVGVDPTAPGDGDGSFVYGVGGGGNSDVFQKLYMRASDTLSDQTNITFQPDNQDDPSVSRNASGDYVMAYRVVGASQNDIEVRRFNASGAQQGAAIAVNQTTAGDQDKPDVAIHPNGDFVVVWQSFGQDGSGYAVMMRRFNATGTALNAETQVNQFITNDQTDAKVAVTPTGGFVVAWQTYNGGLFFNDVFARIYDSSGNPLTGEFRIHEISFFVHETDPDVAVDPSTGKILFVWTAPDDSGTGIYMREFDATGTALTNNLMVNITTTGNQTQPAIAAQEGFHAITWTSDHSGNQNIYLRIGAFHETLTEESPAIVSSDPSGTESSTAEGESGASEALSSSEESGADLGADLGAESGGAAFTVRGEARSYASSAPLAEAVIDFESVETEATFTGTTNLLGQYEFNLNYYPGSYNVAITPLSESGVLSYESVSPVLLPDDLVGGHLDFELQPLFSKKGNAAAVADVGAGNAAAWADFDQDADQDLVVANAGGVALYSNNGNQTFTNVTTVAGLGSVAGARAVAAADYDGNGYPDIYLTRGGANTLLTNNMDGTFTDDTTIAGVGDAGDGYAAAWIDGNFDGKLDLYVVNGGANVYYRNNGDGTFTDETVAAGLSEAGAGRGVAVGDADGDGLPDLYVVNEGAANKLFRNNGNGTFSDATAAAQVGDVGDGRAAAFGDFDNDGDYDLYVVNNGASNLYENNGSGVFALNSTAGVDFTATSSHAVWEDVNADQYLDLMVTTSTGMKLFLNKKDKTFVESSDNADLVTGLRSVAHLSENDYNRDRKSDLYAVVNDASNSANELYQNEIGASKNTIAIKLSGASKYAEITVVAGGKTQVHYILLVDNRPHIFGLDLNTNVTSITVWFASGVTRTLTDQAANQTLTISE